MGLQSVAPLDVGDGAREESDDHDQHKEIHLRFCLIETMSSHAPRAAGSVPFATPVESLDLCGEPSFSLQSEVIQDFKMQCRAPSNIQETSPREHRSRLCYVGIAIRSSIFFRPTDSILLPTFWRHAASRRPRARRPWNRACTVASRRVGSREQPLRPASLNTTPSWVGALTSPRFEAPRACPRRLPTEELAALVDPWSGRNVGQRMGAKPPPTLAGRS
jgi:hypothetical protein